MQIISLNMHDTKMAQAKINSTEKIGLGTTQKLLVPKLIESLWEYRCLFNTGLISPNRKSLGTNECLNMELNNKQRCTARSLPPKTICSLVTPLWPAFCSFKDSMQSYNKLTVMNDALASFARYVLCCNQLSTRHANWSSEQGELGTYTLWFKKKRANFGGL